MFPAGRSISQATKFWQRRHQRPGAGRKGKRPREDPQHRLGVCAKYQLVDFGATKGLSQASGSLSVRQRGRRCPRWLPPPQLRLRSENPELPGGPPAERAETEPPPELRQLSQLRGRAPAAAAPVLGARAPLRAQEHEEDVLPPSRCLLSPAEGCSLRSTSTELALLPTCAWSHNPQRLLCGSSGCFQVSLCLLPA